jgi:hypothetical protein
LPSLPARTAPGRPVFQIHTPDTDDFTTIAGLVKVTGEPTTRLRRLLAKELADNALDAADAASRPGQVSIRKFDRNTYVVSDLGNGLDLSPEALAALFAVHRPRVSTKFLRKPERGALGNGLRVVVGCAVATAGMIEVTAHGQHVVLRPRRAGPTEVVSVSQAPAKPGTTITVRLGSDIPTDEDGDDLIWAEAAIRLAQYAKALPYARQPSARWMDLDDLTLMAMRMDPPATVRQLVEQFDGLTGAKGNRLAAPFGKNRLTNTLTDAELPTLLASMHAAAREVKHTALSPIGPGSHDPDDFDYGSAPGTFTYGTHEPRAVIPYIVEAWASVRTRKGRAAGINEVFSNRTPIVGDTIKVFRSFYQDSKTLRFSGCGLDQFTIDDFPQGDFTADLHIVSPYIPLFSVGKRPNLRHFATAIETALRRAVKRSRDRLPPDMVEPTEKPPPKPPRPPKVEKPRSPTPPPFEPRTPLGKRIAAVAEVTGLKRPALLVLTSDPYDLDNARGHMLGQWFSELVTRFVAEDDQFHLRALFYILVSVGTVYRPDTGALFTNTAGNWRWLQQDASKAARWLNYVPFARIRDQRNDPPEFYPAGSTLTTSGERRLEARGGHCPLIIPNLDHLLPHLVTFGPTMPSQPYQLAFIGEKSSLRPVLKPLAEEFQADLLLSTGDQSETHIAEMAARMAEDPRPAVVLTFCDHDPTGWTMPIAVARKFQALRDLHYPNLNVQVHRVALTAPQCIEYDLPSTPLKPSDLRRTRWLEKTGREQTEIDALAALRPDILGQIGRAALAPFYDPTLAQRFYAATRTPDDARAWFDTHPVNVTARAVITTQHAAFDRAATALTETVRFHGNVVSKAIAADPDRPQLDPAEIIEPDIKATPPEPLFSTADEWSAATAKLIESKRSFGAEDDG